MLVMPYPDISGSPWGWQGCRNPKHDQRSQQSPQLRLRHHIAIAHGSHGHNRPIDAARHRWELQGRPDALDHEDAVTQHHLQQNDEEQKDANGVGTAPQRLSQHAGLINELEQLEHPQNAAELEHPEQQLTAHLRHKEEQYR